MTSNNKDINDQIMMMLLRNDAIPNHYREHLASQYIRTKYYGDKKALSLDDLYRIRDLTRKFLNRIQESGT